MKTLIKAAAFFIVAISLAACQKAVNPVSPSSLTKPNIQSSSDSHYGTIEYTPDSKSSTEVVPFSGTIYFTFDYASSTYKYDAMFDKTGQDSYVRETSAGIKGEGNFERQGTSINLVDAPTVDTSPLQVDFRLDGDYHYSQSGNQIIIEGKNSLGYVKIVLD